MKRPNIILLFLMILACCASRHKEKEFDKTDPVVSEVTPTVSTYQAVFSWQVDLPGKFQTAVEVSKQESMANFIEEGAYTITVLASPTEGGVVSGGGTYQQGQQCTVIATASDRFSFSNWTENGNPVSYDANYTFTVNSNRTLVANFTPLPPNTYNINVSPNPSDGGTVTGGGTYNQGQSCTVTATANSGFTFTNWTENGSVVSTQANFQFTVTGSRTLVAQFQQQSYTITTTADPENGGTVTGGGTYAYGVTCILTATPKEGYTFTHWKKGNTIVSTEPIYSFEVTQNASFTAIFTPIHQYTITVTANPLEGGDVSGGGSYYAGVECILSATPAHGYHFDSWTLNGIVISREPIYNFNVTTSATYIANFSKLSGTHYTITVSADPPEGGTVSGGGTYSVGDTITLTAEPNLGYTFKQWNDDNTDNPRTVIVTSDMEFVAFFEEFPCIDNIQRIAAKDHTDENYGTYTLILVYPNLNGEDYSYQWFYAPETDSLSYSKLTEKTNKPYYYQKGGLHKGYYIVRVFKGECYKDTEPYHVTYKHATQLRIYPNPSRRDHNIVVVNDSDSPSQLSIYSTDGRLLHAQTVTDNQTTLNLNLPSGVYIAYLTDSEGCTKVGKLIIQ